MRLQVADLFCGAGGSSTGMLEALKAMGDDVELIAVNHWDVAVATHKVNHPRHAPRTYRAELDSVRPIDLVPEGHLDMLWASPECVDFSRAKGGRPVSDQRRASAWLINRWLTDLDVDVLLVENVPEFREWGPLLKDGRRDPARKGMYFQAWVNSLWDMGYELDWKLLNAADFGDATTRVRFFLQARKDGQPVRWPAPSHARAGKADMFGDRPRWRAAAEVIDWSDTGPSLIDRKKPLSLKTRLRIARGLERFGGPLAPYYIRLLDLPADGSQAAYNGDFTRSGNPGVQPFTFGNRENNVPRGTDEPFATATTATGGGIGLVTPFVLAQGGGGEARPINEPLPTIVSRGAESLVQPHLVSYYGQSGAASVEEPVPTITTKDRFGLATPQVITLRGTGEDQLGSTSKSVDEPLGTISAGGRHHGLSTPMAVPYGPKAEARAGDQPLPTILTKDRLGLATPEALIVSRHSADRGRPARPVSEPVPTAVDRGAGYLTTPEAFLVPRYGERDGQLPRVHDVSEPLPTLPTTAQHHLATPLIVQMGHTEREDGGMVRDPAKPLPTVTTRINLAVAVAEAVSDTGGIDPRRLVEIDGQTYLLDIRFRMLRNRELAAAMGFPADYQFTGKVAEVTAQIGNAVAVNLSTALVGAAMASRLEASAA